MQRLRIKKTVMPPNFEGCKTMKEYNDIKNVVQDFNLWVRMIRKTKKVYYLDEA